MNRFFVENVGKTNKIDIVGEEYNHLARVLRLKVGDRVECLDGSNLIYECELTLIDKSHAEARVVSARANEANPKCSVTLFQGLPKGDKLELIVQKVSELGVSSVIPFESKFCIAKSNDNKIDRINKIAIGACKQCGRSIPLQVSPTISFDEMIKILSQYDTVLFAYENETGSSPIQPVGRVAIIVGSEGGFSEQESSRLKDVSTCISLGSRILRTETAAIALASIVLNKMGELGR